MSKATTFVRSAFFKIRKAAGLTSATGPDGWHNFSIVNRKITPPLSCELNAVDHCNISCLDCNHAAPAVEQGFADPDKVYEDFSRLAKVYRAKRVKIIGGEPLLHPDLLALIRAVRTSEIGKEIVVVTNGTLLEHMSDAVWQAIDRIEISSYPETGLREDQFRSLHKKAEQHRVIVDRYFYRQFRVTFSTIGTTDEHLVRRIFRACKLSHLWGCQSIYQGSFYKCPQCIYIPKLLDPAATHDRTIDGVKIEESETFFSDLVRYLSSQEPLQACRYCLGSVGIHRPHRLVNKAEWKMAHRKPSEELIDHRKLCAIESGGDVPDIQKMRLSEDMKG